MRAYVSVLLCDSNFPFCVLLDTIRVECMYDYKAEVIRVVDNDTIRLKVSVGFHMHYEGNFRLNRIDAPEDRSESCCMW